MVAIGGQELTVILLKGSVAVGEETESLSVVEAGIARQPQSADGLAYFVDMWRDNFRYYVLKGAVLNVAPFGMVGYDFIDGTHVADGVNGQLLLSLFVATEAVGRESFGGLTTDKVGAQSVGIGSLKDALGLGP